MSASIRLLHVEDSEDDAALVARELTRAGYAPQITRVQTAEGFREALDREPWDMVISDFSMPGFNGTAALRLLRERDQQTPFIFVSGTIGEEIAVQAMRDGAQDYVIKGNLRRLAPAVERELRELGVRRKRREAEEALRAAEQRLHHVVDATPAVIYLMRVQGSKLTTQWVSDNIEHITGYTAAETLEPGWLTEHVHPDDLDVYRADIPALLERGRDVREFRARGKDGAWHWVLDERRVLRDERGEPSEVVGVVLDITERKSLEAQLVQAQKMEAIGRLAGGIAHDFNNIIGAIFMEIDCALADLPADHLVTDGLRQVRRAAEQAAGMTRQLLAFSRRQITENTVFTFNDVVTDAERMLRRLIGEDVTLSVRPAPDIASVRADRGQVEQVLVNLVVNARDAMPRGGSLTIETENEALDAAYAAQHRDVAAGPYAVLSVTDTGTGMPPEIQARIFEPFFTTKERGKGTGLGLATSYGIVKQAGGHIRLHSEPGRGTKFRIYLPAVSEAATSRPAPAPVVERRGTETILLVEDSDPLRGAAVRILRSLGYRVLEAVDGPSAVRQLEEMTEPIHLLLTDVVLPGVQGQEVAARALELRRDIRVLFTSGYSQDSATLQRLLDEGAALLPKPYTQDILSRRVREALDAPKPVSR